MLILFLFLADTPSLTQAQVILNGLNSLFEAVESQTLNMLDQVEEITVPDEWRNTDLVKQTKEVMVSEESHRFTGLIFGSIKYFYLLHHHYYEKENTLRNKIINLKSK